MKFLGGQHSLAVDFFGNLSEKKGQCFLFILVGALWPNLVTLSGAFYLDQIG